MPTRILIAGAEGQFGRILQGRLGKDFNILATAKSPTNQAVINRQVLTMNICNFEQVIDVVRSFKPDVVVNCAAMTNVDDCETDHNSARLINVKGVENLLKATGNDIRFIQISTDYIFDGLKGPYTENDSTYPVNYYGRTKLEAENIIRGSRHPFLILRGSVLYGNPLNSKSNFFSWVYDSLFNKSPINIVTDQVSNPAWIPLFSDAVYQGILLNAEGIYHFGSDDYLSRYDFALMVAEVFNFDPTLITPVDSKTFNCPAKRPSHSGLKIDKITDELKVKTLSTKNCLLEIKRQMVIA